MPLVYAQNVPPLCASGSGVAVAPRRRDLPWDPEPVASGATRETLTRHPRQDQPGVINRPPPFFCFVFPPENFDHFICESDAHDLPLLREDRPTAAFASSFAAPAPLHPRLTFDEQITQTHPFDLKRCFSDHPLFKDNLRRYLESVLFSDWSPLNVWGVKTPGSFRLGNFRWQPSIILWRLGFRPFPLPFVPFHF